MSKSNLSKKQRDTLRSILGKMQASATVSEYRSVPVSIQEWIEDPFYSGDTCKKLYPFWKNVLTDIFSHEEIPYTQICIQGGIGTGKSTAGAYIMARFIYELSCYSCLGRSVGLFDTSQVVFLVFSLSKFQARRTGYKDLRILLDSIPYFREQFPRNMHNNDELRFPQNLLGIYGTGTGDSIGMNVILSVIDEANFFANSSGNSTSFAEVADLHRALVARQASRFSKNGKNRSLSLVISSSTFKSSFTEELVKRSYTDTEIKCYRARRWDIMPVGTFSKAMFPVFCGNDKFEPSIIESLADLAHFNVPYKNDSTLEDGVNSLPVELRSLIDFVPKDFKNQYEINIVKSLQDFSGFSVDSQGKLFSNRLVFEACVDDNIADLFSKTAFTIEINNDSPTNNIMFYLSQAPFPDRDKPRYIHVDLGLTNDAASIACSYVSGTKVMDGVEQKVFKLDFSLRIVPPAPPGRISIARIEEFIIYLRNVLKLTFGMISYDSFQSEASLQRLRELGFPTRLQSVDRNENAYLFFVESMYRECVHFSNTLARDIEGELFNLDYYREKHKIDHPGNTASGGTKDRMDALVGSIYNAQECVVASVNYGDTLSLATYNIEEDKADKYLSLESYDY